EFAVTIGAAILVSGLVSLTLTPMLCARFLKSHAGETHGRLYNSFERAFNAMLNGYKRTLGFAMRHRPLTLVFSVVILVLNGVIFTNIGKGLFPSDDTGLLSGSTEAAQGTSFPEMMRLQQLVNKTLEKDTNVAG